MLVASRYRAEEGKGRDADLAAGEERAGNQSEESRNPANRLVLSDALQL